MKPKFLLDENLSKTIKFAVLLINDRIDIVCVGDPDTPSLGTLNHYGKSYCVSQLTESVH